MILCSGVALKYFTKINPLKGRQKGLVGQSVARNSSLAFSAISQSTISQSPPKVLFVLGGPGVGKGTQCEKIVHRFDAWCHISAGDCLREEQQDPKSVDGEIINACIKEGAIVPSGVTVKLLQKAMDSRLASGRRCFLIDGFPRNLENDSTFRSEIRNEFEVVGVLFFQASEHELETRLLSRAKTSGRIDDNMRSIQKRLRTYHDETMPVVRTYQDEDKLFSINAGRDIESVWLSTQELIERLEEKHH